MLLRVHSLALRSSDVDLHPVNHEHDAGSALVKTLSLPWQQLVALVLRGGEALIAETTTFMAANSVHIDEYGKNRAQGDVKSIVRAIFHTIVYVSFWGKVLF